jgi:hypothetical protein
MPADISSTYAPGSQSTTTRGGFPGIAGGGFGIDPSMFSWLVRKRLIGGLHQEQNPDYHEPSPNEKALDQARTEAEIAKYRAISQPPPLRQVSGPQIIPGNVLDTNAMTGAQRTQYLPSGAREGDPRTAGLGPSGAGVSPGPAPADVRADKEQSDREFRLRQQFADEQKRQQDVEDRQDREDAYRKQLLAQQGQRTSGPGMPGSRPAANQGANEYPEYAFS